MHSISFLHDLAVVMIVAGLVTILFHRLRQPVVLGYILAGVIIGPHTPPFPLIDDDKAIETLAELGVIFLMFSLGLEFSLRKLRDVGVTAVVAASLEILLMVWLGYEVGLWFGWSLMDSLFLGAILSISSTTIIIKALGDLGKTKEKFSELIFGILIVEDVLAIVMIALLSGFAKSGSLSPQEIGMTIGQLGIFLTTVLVVGLLTVPRLLGYVNRFQRNEMLLVTVLGLCFGVCLLTVKLGYSVALGAFLIGAIIAESREIGKIARLTEPLRDMFSAVFFVAIGLLIDPRMLVNYALPIAVITAAVVVGKVLSCSFGTFVAGNDTRTSLRVGMGLAQIGEFSFIIASLGLTLKATSDFLYPIAVTVSAITTLLTPYLIRSADGLVNWFDRCAPERWVRHMELYTQWVSRLGSGRKGGLAARLIKKWLWQLGLNTVLTVGIFVSAAFLARSQPDWLPELPGGPEALKSILWFAAVLCSLPLLIASFRKMQAMAMVISEITVSRAAAGERTAGIRALIAQILVVASLIGLGLLVLVLSSTLLPPANVLLVLILIVAGITWLLWRSFVKVYAKAQIALVETFANPPPARHAEETNRELSILKDAELRLVTVPVSGSAAHKLISELRLRTLTGASIAGIQRDGRSIINPGPDEELKPGDLVLLLGLPEQIQRAEAMLSSVDPVA